MSLPVLVAGLVVLGAVLVADARRADASSCAESVPTGQIRVVVVVDAGDAGGPSAACLVVPVGTTGSQALARRAAEMGVPTPRYAASGLLCAIDGLPAPPACGDRNSDGFRYWAYFNGSSGEWVYGTYNPFIRRLSDGDIEGWRFVDGVGNGSDPPPRSVPSRALFAAVAPSVTVPIEANAGAVGGPSTTPGGGPTSAGTPVTVVTATSTEGSTVDAASLVVAAGASDGAADGPVELAVVTVGSRSGSSWVAVGVVVMVIAALGIGAIVRSRTRA